MADPNGLVVADAAARAVEFVGMPEAQLNLAHAVIYLANAPKSNSVITALGAAMQDVRDQPAGAVPAHLRDAHYPGAAKLGHGEGYVYPHDETDGWVEQQYRPDDHVERYWTPTGRGGDVDRRAAGDRTAGRASVSGSEWAAVLAAQVCLVALVVLVVVIVRLDRAAKDLRRAAPTSGPRPNPPSPSSARSSAPPTSSSTGSTPSSPAPSASAAGSTPRPTSPTAPSPTRWSRRSRSAPAPSGRSNASRATTPVQAQPRRRSVLWWTL